MTQKYKLKKENGFNPFKNKLIESLSLHLTKKAPQKIVDIDCKQFAIIINNEKKVTQSQTDKIGAFVGQHIQLHIQSNDQSQTKQLIMFNDKEYCQKEFKQIYQSQQISQNYPKFIKEFSQTSNFCSKYNTSKLLVYLSNSRQFSQNLLNGQNLTKVRSGEYQQNHESFSSNILTEIYRQMLLNKNKQQQSQIYFSSIGIKKQNQLYDLLNEQYLEIMQQDIKKVPLVKVRKIGSQADSVSAENLKRQIISDEKDFSYIFSKSVSIKNQIQYFDNFNQSFFIGEVYHFFQANETFDILNQTILIKINQSLATNMTFDDGFYERRMKEDNASRMFSFLMRMGLNIKNCRKNRIIMQIEAESSNKLSKIQTHESKILLYLSPLFCNQKTSYILINEIDPSLGLDEMIRKFQLNKSFSSQQRNDKKKRHLQNSFYYVNHYLDNSQVLNVVKKLAVKYFVKKQNKNQSNRHSSLSKYSTYSERKNASNFNNNQLHFTDTLVKYRPSSTQLSQQQNSAKNSKNKYLIRHNSKYSQKIKSKSFFSQTIISAQRNFLKFKERQLRKNLKSVDQKDKQLQNQEQKPYYISKTINQRVEGLQFVEDNYLMPYRPLGMRVSYKRRMVVKKAQQILPKNVTFQ